MGNPVSDKLSIFHPVPTIGHVFMMLRSLLWHLLTKFSLGCKHCAWKGMCGWGRTGLKLLKLAQLYPLHSGPYGIYYIRKPVNKVFPMIILNNNKYSGHCTLSWVCCNILEIGSTSLITYKVFYLSGVNLKELLLLCGSLWL